MLFQILFPEISRGMVHHHSGRLRHHRYRVRNLNRISVLRPEAIPVRPLLPIAVRAQATLHQHIGEQRIRWHRRDCRMFMVVSHTRNLRNISVTPTPKLITLVSMRRIVLRNRDRTSLCFSHRSRSTTCQTILCQAILCHPILRSLTWRSLT